MGLDVSVLTDATFVKTKENATDEDWDTLVSVYVNPDFPRHADGLPGGFYRGEVRHTAHWSYGGYSAFRADLCRAAFGVEPEEVWKAPEPFTRLEHGGMVALINFADNEGAIGPKTAKVIGDAMEKLEAKYKAHVTSAYSDPDELDWALDSFVRMQHTMREAADGAGFALWH